MTERPKQQYIVLVEAAQDDDDGSMFYIDATDKLAALKRAVDWLDAHPEDNRPAVDLEQESPR